MEFYDICMSWSSLQNDMEANFLNLEIEVRSKSLFLNINF